MRKLTELLATLGGSDVIRQCWGEVPAFVYGEILHLKQSHLGNGELSLQLTIFLMTNGPEDVNECKPSRLEIEFSRVLYWEYDSSFAEANGIRPSDLLTSPPPGTIAVDVDHSFYIVCRSVQVLSCVRNPMQSCGEP